MFWQPQLSQNSLQRIFSEICGGFLTFHNQKFTTLASNIVKASVEMYERVQTQLLPTPSKSHYTFNLRDLSKVSAVCIDSEMNCKQFFRFFKESAQFRRVKSLTMRPS